MSTIAMVQGVFGALAVIMAGLGLSLRLDDFKRIGRHWNLVAAGILVQMIVLPLLALGLAIFLRMPPLLSVGMMLLAATPGSISANLYSHLFGGDVAFNVSLTALNTLLCAITLPFVCAWSLEHFAGTHQAIPILMDKAMEIMGVVFVPIAAGMIVRAMAPGFAERAIAPMKIISGGVVVLFSVAAIVNEWKPLKDGFLDVASGVLALNALSILIPYCVARTFSIDRRTMITIAFQSSIHNALLAIYVALAILNQPLIALPAAIYSITMNLIGVTFGIMVRTSSGAPKGLPPSPQDSFA